MSNERDWQLEVTGTLGKLVEQTTNLTTQVARQNGNVARLWETADKAKVSLAEHQEHCPLLVIVQGLQRQLDRGEHPIGKPGIVMLDELRERLAGIERLQMRSSARELAQTGVISWVWLNVGKPAMGALIVIIAMLVIGHASLFQGLFKP